MPIVLKIALSTVANHIHTLMTLDIVLNSALSRLREAHTRTTSSSSTVHRIAEIEKVSVSAMPQQSSQGKRVPRRKNRFGFFETTNAAPNAKLSNPTSAIISPKRPFGGTGLPKANQQRIKRAKPPDSVHNASHSPVSETDTKNDHHGDAGSRRVRAEPQPWSDSNRSPPHRSRLSVSDCAHTRIPTLASKGGAKTTAQPKQYAERERNLPQVWTAAGGLIEDEISHLYTFSRSRSAPFAAEIKSETADMVRATLREETGCKLTGSSNRLLQDASSLSRLMTTAAMKTRFRLLCLPLMDEIKHHSCSVTCDGWTEVSASKKSSSISVQAVHHDPHHTAGVGSVFQVSKPSPRARFSNKLNVHPPWFGKQICRSARRPSSNN
jgi:hypothetical protein